MDKIIKQEQLQAVLQLLAKYNVGVQEYSAVEKLFKELPEVKEEPKKK
jgi:hypothetical protein